MQNSVVPVGALGPNDIVEYGERFVNNYISLKNFIDLRFNKMRNDDENEELYYGKDDTVYSVEATFRIGTEKDDFDTNKIISTLQSINTEEDLTRIFDRAFDTENERYDVSGHLGNVNFPEYHFTYYIEKLFAITLLSNNLFVQTLHYGIHNLLQDRKDNLIQHGRMFNLIKLYIYGIFTTLENERVISELFDKNLINKLSDILANENFSENFYENTLIMYNKLYGYHPNLNSVKVHYIFLFSLFLLSCFNIKAICETREMSNTMLTTNRNYIERYHGLLSNEINPENFNLVVEMFEEKINNTISNNPLFRVLIPQDFNHLKNLLIVIGVDKTYFQKYFRILNHKSMIGSTNLLVHLLEETYYHSVHATSH